MPHSRLTNFFQNYGVTYLVVLLSFLLSANQSVQSDPVDFNLTQSFFNPNPTGNDSFGARVAFAGDFVLVGSYRSTVTASQDGVAYLYHAITGELVRTFNNPEPAVDDLFGSGGAWIGNDLVVIGARGDDVNGLSAGRAFVFSILTGDLVNVLESPNPTGASLFGHHVYPLGENVLISAPRDSINGVATGRVHLFDPRSGSLLQTFEDPNPAEGNQFGWNIDGYQDYVLVGADRDDTQADDGGIAYLFRGSDGQLLQTYQNPFPGSGDRFGGGTAIVQGRFAVIGSAFDSTMGTKTGSAFVFDLLSGNYLRGLYSPNPQRDSLFGVTASYNEFAIIGAQQEANGGRAYLFNPDGGDLVHTFIDPVPGNGGIQYGARSAGYRNKVLVGAFADDTAGSNAGAAFLYETQPSVWCVESGTVDFQCAGSFAGMGSTEEVRIQIVVGDSGGSGCDVTTVDSESVLVDFAVDCSSYVGLSSPSCPEILDGLVTQLGLNITAQSKGQLEWKSESLGQVEIYGQVPFSLLVHSSESGAATDESYVLETCPIVNLCDGIEGNEIGVGHTDGLAIEFQKSICPPTPTPTSTVTPSNTPSPTPTSSNTPTNTYTPTPTFTPTPTNAPPSGPVVSLMPLDPNTLADLVCNATGSVDPDGAEVNYNYRWYENETPIAGETSPSLDHNLTVRDREYRCVVTPFDGIENGPSGEASVVIANTPPTSPEINILPAIPTPDDGIAVVITTESTDIDDDRIVYLFEWFDSLNGVDWHRRTELSGNLNPFFPGEPEISNLWTRLVQAAEYWRVDVTPVEIPQGVAKEDLEGVSKGFVVGEAASKEWFVLPDLDGDNQVGAEDVLLVHSLWGTTKESLPQADQELLFSETATATDEVGLEHLLNLALTWEQRGE